MKIIEKEILLLEEKEILRVIRNNEFPAQFNYHTIEEFEVYINGLSNAKHYLLLDEENEIQGWAFTFLREEEDWFSIMLNKQFQGKGNGSLLLQKLKKNNSNLSGWVIDHENDIKQNKEQYKSPLLFYIINGFNVLSEIRIENEKISAVKIIWNRKE
ncbi:hypothetical protein IRZ71_03250 [Flavobacterium sp. ANB]|uniref:hypothetical protein n=1 Tax=unclassified Flavobacterium TaxID=196869 RepID=UPI0012B8FF9B|nr:MULTISPECIES: hypothetical protein [unclassified Flavobacterium]MBF4515337.1 hypothetical protein [Flavobacterium sp. ANB]MTD70249.1 hypothetical protein [Flavobacterium sp. LC2016-13]